MNQSANTCLPPSGRWIQGAKKSRWRTRIVNIWTYMNINSVNAPSGAGVKSPLRWNSSCSLTLSALPSRRCLSQLSWISRILFSDRSSKRHLGFLVWTLYSENSVCKSFSCSVVAFDDWNIRRKSPTQLCFDFFKNTSSGHWRAYGRWMRGWTLNSQKTIRFPSKESFMGSHWELPYGI